MALNNYQFSFGSFVFGGTGSPFQVYEIDGLEGLPDISSQDDNRGFNDGMYSGRDFLRGRTITMTILTFAGNGNSAQQNFNLLQGALIPQQTDVTPLNFLMSVTDVEMTIGARVRSRRTTVDPDYTFGFIRSQYTFFCPDPRYYNATTTTVSLIPVQALGRTYDRIYDLTYGGGASGASVNNNGTTTTYPTITITGPISNPTISNNTTGQFVTVNTTLGVSDSLVINLYEKTITLNGSYARNLLNNNSQWFGCAPGTTIISFTGSTYTIGTTTATMTYSPAFV
jgi:hypothetical protein